MSEFRPVSTLADLAALDDDDIVAGYRYGIGNAAEPGSDKSRSFWHGWRNAQTDMGRAPVDVEQQQLAREIVGATTRWH